MDDNSFLTSDIRKDVLRPYLERLANSESFRKKVLAIREYAIEKSISEPEKPYTFILRDILNTQMVHVELNRLELLFLGISASYIQTIKNNSTAVEMHIIEKLEEHLAPNEYEYWLQKGHILFKREEYFLSVRCYDKAIEINKHKPLEALSWKGQALFHLGTFAAGLGSPPSQESRCALWYELETFKSCFEEALRCFNQVIELEPSNSESYVLKAECLIEFGRPAKDFVKLDRAIECLRLALKVDPSNVSARERLRQLGEITS
jgi:tetratricopeptide (TPR) repeat protein